MKARPALEPAPKAIVAQGLFEYGRFGGFFGRANMLDAARVLNYPLPRFVKNWRLKEWQAFQLGNERWFVFTALYDVKLFSLAYVQIYDRREKRRYGFERIIPGSAFAFPEELTDYRVAYRGPGTFLEYSANPERGEMKIELGRNNFDRARRFSASFRFSSGPKFSAPQSVCLPLGMNRAIYSTKLLMPVEGELVIGAETHLFEAASAMGVFDDHKGYYPWRLRYDWVSGFGLDAKGRRIGFNLTDNQVRDQARYNENCLWINNRIWPLPPVKVTRPQGPAGEWIIQDTEGMVDLVFVPEVMNDISLKLGILQSDYHGPFGSFRGLLKNGEGEKINAELLYGAGEQQYLRA
ncbi:MAG TPA: DUF2804 domain-containing protein [Rectinemataceae bacterium]|nr:DUF2804 domain-containing protein [Rectinemataceae bacterium]